jgi:hypothetical protein
MINSLQGLEISLSSNTAMINFNTQVIVEKRKIMIMALNSLWWVHCMSIKIPTEVNDDSSRYFVL